MSNNVFFVLKNHSESIPTDNIPILPYGLFSDAVTNLFMDESSHCLMYFAYHDGPRLRFIMAVGCDNDASILLCSHVQDNNCKALPSLTPRVKALHVFEREISENHGIEFIGHPWLKPIRFPLSTGKSVYDYPFYSMSGGQLHQVGVGPVHAGIIEPGHFRFTCNGEKVLHLEIQLGYQHRHIEKMMKEILPMQRMVLSESIAGDSVIAHASTHARLIESLSGIKTTESIEFQRTVALELERLAIHIGDTSALCTDVAYQLGQVVNEALRTTIINSTQLWCGNRFGKGLIRVGGSHYHLTEHQRRAIMETLKDSYTRYRLISERIYSLPSVLSRFDGIGALTYKQVHDIGAVGMAARMAGLSRDIRKSHPFGMFVQTDFNPVIENTGDVLARGMVRMREAYASFELLLHWLQQDIAIDEKLPEPVCNLKLRPSHFAIKLTEGWRGETCHAAVTGTDGNLVYYKIKDPSFHNWFALALAMRGQEISDFPICNKSFNLSYCGHDL